ncbi:hypothetical protein SDRG_12309, partial [Saprolegnia diclina VS20]
MAVRLNARRCPSAIPEATMTTRRRPNPMAVLAVPELVELMARYVQNIWSLTEFIASLPPPAVTPHLAAIAALAALPDVVRIQWPKVYVLSLPDDATLQHLLEAQALGAIVAVMDVDRDGPDARTPRELLRRLQPVVNHVTVVTNLSHIQALQSMLCACPRLHSLVFEHSHHWAGITMSMVADVFANLPLAQLRTLVLRGKFPASAALAIASMLRNGCCTRLGLANVEFVNLRAEDRATLCEAIATCTTLRDLCIEKTIDISTRFLQQEQLPHQLQHFRLDVSTPRELFFHNCSDAVMTSLSSMLSEAPRLTQLEGRFVTQLAETHEVLSRLTTLRIEVCALDEKLLNRLVALVPRLVSLRQLDLHEFSVKPRIGASLATALTQCAKLQYLSAVAETMEAMKWLATVLSGCPQLHAIKLQLLSRCYDDLIELVRSLQAASPALRWIVLEKQAWPISGQAKKTKTLAAMNVTLEYVDMDMCSERERDTYAYWDAKAAKHQRLVVFLYYCPKYRFVFD